MRRRGAALVLVLGLVLTIGAFGAIVRLLSHAAYQELDVVTAHLHAVAVGEAAFARVVARLAATPWEQRWFKSGPEVQRDQPAADGTYTYVLRDTPRPAPYQDPLNIRTLGGPRQADLLVRATYGRSSVSLFWRLTVREDALDSLARVIPSCFAFAPDEAPATPAAMDPISQMVDDKLRERERNLGPFGDRQAALDPTRTAPEVAGVLGMPDPGDIVDSVTPPGGTPVPNEVPIDAERTRRGNTPPVPTPPGPPPPTAAPPTGCPPNPQTMGEMAACWTGGQRACLEKTACLLRAPVLANLPVATQIRAAIPVLIQRGDSIFNGISPSDPSAPPFTAAALRTQVGQLLNAAGSLLGPATCVAGALPCLF